MKKHIYNMVKLQLESDEGNDYLAEILEDRDSSQNFEIEDAIELYSAYLMFLSEEQENNFNRFEIFNHLFEEMRELLSNYSIKFSNNDTVNFLKYLKENYLENNYKIEPLTETEQVDDVKALNKIIELGAKGALKELNVITQELSKDIAEDKKISLLTKQNEYLQALQIYFDKK